MANIAVRSLLAPAVAMAVAGTAVITPGVAVPATPAVVHVKEIALAGIGQDIYYAITPAVQYAVGGVSYLINFLPLVGAPIAAQININYFQGIQPVIESTVDYLAAVVQDPLNVVAATAAYAGTLYDIGYNWVSAEAVFVGLQPLPPLPQVAASTPKTADRSVASEETSRVRRAALPSAGSARPAASTAEKSARPGGAKKLRTARAAG